MTNRQVLGYLKVEERLRVFRFLLAHWDMTFFIFPSSNAHDYRSEMVLAGGDVIAINLGETLEYPHHGYIGAAGYRTFTDACTALTGSNLPYKHMHRHYIITREGLEKVTQEAEIERVKLALYS
jgi:hypothetical protein